MVADFKQLHVTPRTFVLMGGLAFAVAAQMLVSLSMSAVPVIAPELAKARGLDVQLIALYFPLIYFTAFLTNFFVPKLLSSVGGAGLSLICVLAGAAGLFLTLPPSALLTAMAPVVIGLAVGGITPATSQVVGPHITLRTAGLIMSIRQSSLPAGSMLAGIILPLLAIYWSWHPLFVTGLASAGLVILLLPTLRWFNDHGVTPPPAQSPLEPLKRLLAMPSMPPILFAILVYMMMVSCLRTFFTVYLVRDLGFPITTAGLAFGAAQLAGIPGQTACAILSDRWLSPRVVLAVNGFSITAAAIAAANFDRHWPLAVIVTVGVILGFFSMGSSPVMLGEIARRAPAGHVGALVSGGNLSIMAGCGVGPLLFGAAATLFGYSGGLVAVALLTLAGAIAVTPRPFQRTLRRASESAVSSAESEAKPA